MDNCKKTSFATEHFAQEYIEKLNKTSNRKIIPERAYLCEKCLNWHLTSAKRSDYYDLLKDYKTLLKRIESNEKTILKRERTIEALNNRIKKLSESANYYNDILRKLHRCERKISIIQILTIKYRNQIPEEFINELK